MDLKDIKDEEYDIVIDKSTLDSLLCGENSFHSVAKMLWEV